MTFETVEKPKSPVYSIAATGGRDINIARPELPFRDELWRPLLSTEKARPQPRESYNLANVTTLPILKLA